MSSISAVTSTTSSYYPAAPVQRDDQDPMAKVADVLGLSRDDLKSALESGKSLNDLAGEQGVSHDDLIAAIKQGLPSDQASATSSTGTTESADEIAEKIAGTSGMPTPPPGPPPGGPKGENACLQDDSKLSQLSELLNMDSTEVAEQATSASSLVSLLQSRNVDLYQLKSVLSSGDLLDVAA